MNLALQRSFHDGRVTLYGGDCLVGLDTLADDCVDAIVTDPPYHLTSIVKRFGAPNAAKVKPGSALGHAHARLARGFMGQRWDGGDLAFKPETWAALMRVVKPGGHLTAFAAPRNAHRMTCAIEDAGFEIRDCLMWLFATGFPKSHDEGEGRGTALKPAYEPIVLARKPMSERTVARNIAKWGTGALNIDACRVEGDCTKRVNHAEMGYGGGNRAERYQTGSDLGRWPANVMHDGSDEIVGALPDSKGQQGDVRGTEPSRTGDANTVCYGEYGRVPFAKRTDSGSAARFFYCAKASKAERIGSGHPAVKPLKLMRWLVRLVTPMGGLVLDPFAGTGMTAEAALLEGFRSVLMENEAEYCGDVGRRLTRFNPDAR